MVQAQLSEPHGAGGATSSPARLHHSSFQCYLHPPGSRISFSNWQDLAAGPAQRSPAFPQAGCQHLAGGRAPVQLGCCVCLDVRGGPGDGSRVGKMLTLLDTKPFPRQQRLPSDVWMCSQSLHPSSARHFHDLGTGEPGNLPNLDHLSSHFIPGCSGSMVSSDALAEAVGGSMDLGWHMGLVIVLCSSLARCHWL